MSESLTVRPDADFSSMVTEHILALARPLFEEADRQRSHITTPEDLRARQRYVRDTFTRLIGGLPARTPLRPRRLRRLARPGYTLEMIVFESRPAFYVPAHLYLPEGRGRAPAILVSCGHAPEGKAVAATQALAQGLAQHGFVVLVADPIGQGERAQYWDPVRRESRIGLCCPEHDYAGAQALLVGSHLAAWRIWDGIRALDYLVGRDEVDTARIGCTGCSGGGTLATYLFALDERIAAAMPVCFVTSREAWLATGCLADAEQVQDGIIEAGIDHADLCAAAAPRPLRVGAARGDYVPLDGTRRTVGEVRRLYGILDAADRVDLAEVDGEHGYSRPLREAAAHWFHLWLGDPSAMAEEPPVEPLPPEDLWCAPRGHVGSLGSRTVFCFTRDAARALPPPVPALATRGEAERWQGELRDRLRHLLRCPASSGAPRVDSHGTLYRGKLGIERLAFASERGITIPALLFVPDKQGVWPGMVYVQEDGKQAEAGPKGTLPMLAGEGNAVLAVDVRGVGETASADRIAPSHPHMGVEGYHLYQYGMLGHTLVGRRVHDVLRAVAVLLERPEVEGESVSVVGQGLGGLLALFAAALDERVGTAVCCQSLLHYRAIATHEYPAYHPRWFVPRILRECDLPQVAACVAPRRLVLAGPLDHAGRRVLAARAEKAYASTRGIYRLFEAEDAFQIDAV